MKALTFQGPRTVHVSDLPAPTLPDSDSVLIEVTASGICGSDLHTFDGHAFVSDTGFSLGHEAVGRIIESGSNVRSVKVGDRVLIPGSAGCNRCQECAGGWAMRCTGEGPGVYGIGVGLDGLQAQFAAVRNADRNVVAIPEGISDDAAVLLTDNLPTGWCSARQADVRPGAVVVVVGLGPVGLCAVMSAVAMGASRVLAIDPLADRRQAAEKYGAEGVYNDDVVAAVRELTRGRNADCVIEAVGHNATIETSIQLAAVGGTVAIAGVPVSMAIEFPLMHVFAAQIAVKSALCSVQRELPVLLPLVEHGRLIPEEMVSHHFSLSEGQAAYDTFAQRKPGTQKVVFDNFD